ncbi:uncharacterized protein [Haliotis asinina]|uniref:uncharacterized protein n=1 Tax=Haliotis asinina TaxID=109174 RepID=UPI003531CBE2
MQNSWMAFTVVAVATLCVCVSGMGMGKSAQSFGDGQNNDQRYQKWYEWMVKRQLGSNDLSFGRYLQDGGKFLDWGSVFDGGRGKRQLSGFPDKFGNYQRFFTNGLQDWKSTFNGEKRVAPEE